MAHAAQGFADAFADDLMKGTPEMADGPYPPETLPVLNPPHDPLQFAGAGPSKLFTAMIAAQTDMGAVIKDTKNDFFRSKYATLADIQKVILPVLNKHDLGVMQVAKGGLLAIKVTTIVFHKSGESFRSTIELPMVQMKLDKATGQMGYTPQAAGSATTYACRYAFNALFCIIQEDDDGNAASHTFKDKMVSDDTKEKLAKLACPKCGVVGAIIKGKAEYGGGWLCFKKKKGCGAKLTKEDFKKPDPQSDPSPPGTTTPAESPPASSDTPGETQDSPFAAIAVQMVEQINSKRTPETLTRLVLQMEAQLATMPTNLQDQVQEAINDRRTYLAEKQVQ